jgi:hypothetical protein
MLTPEHRTGKRDKGLLPNAAGTNASSGTEDVDIVACGGRIMESCPAQNIDFVVSLMSLEMLWV